MPYGSWVGAVSCAERMQVCLLWAAGIETLLWPCKRCRQGADVSKLPHAYTPVQMSSSLEPLKSTHLVNLLVLRTETPLTT